MTPGSRRVAASVCLLGAGPLLGGCGTVLGIEPWDVEPGAGGGSIATTSGGGGERPSTTGTVGGADPGTGGADGGGDGVGGATSTTGVGGAGGDEGCGVPDTTEHCGVCGRSCWGGPCNAGVCGPVQLPGFTARADLLAVSGDHVVFVDGGNVLRRVRKSSWTSATELGGIPGAVTSLAAGVFDGMHAAFHATDGRITRHLLDQADPTPLHLLDDPAYYPRGLVPSGGFVFWFDAATAEVGGAGVRRSAWNLGGTSQPYCPAVDVQDLAMIGQTAFFVKRNATTPSLQLLQCSGFGNGDFLADAPGHVPFRVEADAATGLVYHVVFPNPDPPVAAGVWRKPAAGGATELVVGAEAQYLAAFTHGGAYLYGRSAQGELLSASKQPGSAIEVLAADQVQAIAADEQGVYWGSNTGIWALRRD